MTTFITSTFDNTIRCDISLGDHLIHCGDDEEDLYRNDRIETFDKELPPDPKIKGTAGELVP